MVKGLLRCRCTFSIWQIWSDLGSLRYLRNSKPAHKDWWSTALSHQWTIFGSISQEGNSTIDWRKDRWMHLVPTGKLGQARSMEELFWREASSQFVGQTGQWGLRYLPLAPQELWNKVSIYQLRVDTIGSFGDLFRKGLESSLPQQSKIKAYWYCQAET